jgi:hypothetical protein
MKAASIVLVLLNGKGASVLLEETTMPWSVQDPFCRVFEVASPMKDSETPKSETV